MKTRFGFYAIGLFTLALTACTANPVSPAVPTTTNYTTNTFTNIQYAQLRYNISYGVQTNLPLTIFSVTNAYSLSSTTFTYQGASNYFTIDNTNQASNSGYFLSYPGKYFFVVQTTTNQGSFVVGSKAVPGGFDAGSYFLPYALLAGGKYTFNLTIPLYIANSQISWQGPSNSTTGLISWSLDRDNGN